MAKNEIHRTRKLANLLSNISEMINQDIFEGDPAASSKESLLVTLAITAGRLENAGDIVDGMLKRMEEEEEG